LTMRRHQLLGASAMAFCLLDHDNSPEFRRDIDGRLFQSRCAKSTSEIEQQNELSRDGVQKRKRPAHWPASLTKELYTRPQVSYPGGKNLRTVFLFSGYQRLPRCPPYG